MGKYIYLYIFIYLWTIFYLWTHLFTQILLYNIEKWNTENLNHLGDGEKIRDVLCQLISESPVPAVVRHHELLQLVQILPPFVCMQELQQDACGPALLVQHSNVKHLKYSSSLEINNVEQNKFITAMYSYGFCCPSQQGCSRTFCAHLTQFSCFKMFNLTLRKS